jgi:hypothetical protein
MVAVRIPLGLMPSGVVAQVRAWALLLLALCSMAGCSGAGVFREYEYDEEMYLALDGSVTVNVTASVAALIALRGMDLDPDPSARIDRDQTRALFEGRGARATVNLARRDLRRFVRARVRADSVEQLSQLAPFAWSTYRFERRGDVFQFRQVVGPPSGRSQDDLQWTGREMVRFRLHLPSEVVFHNSPSGTVLRGNILEWEQSLTDRLAGQPVEMAVDLEPESILSTTLWLFGSTIVAAAATLAFAVWWIARQGRGSGGAVPRS